MRKFYFLFFMLCFGALTVSAQDVSEDNDSYRFVTNDGKELQPGASLDVTTGVYDEIDDVFKMEIPAAVVNKSGESGYSIRLRVDIKEIDNGSFQTCWPDNCLAPWSTTGTYYGSTASAYAQGTKKALQTEWIADNDNNGKCQVVLTVEQGYQAGDDFMAIYAGPSLTVTFYKGITPASIQAPKAVSTRPATYFSVDGKRLDKSAKGLVIVRQGDGTVKKVLNK